MNTAVVQLPTTDVGPNMPNRILVTDNSRVVPVISDYEVTQIFDIGTTMVMISATDNAGNVGSCTLEIVVIGRYPFMASGRHVWVLRTYKK